MLDVYVDMIFMVDGDFVVDESTDLFLIQQAAIHFWVLVIRAPG
jgi:hypothetical protein